jgi:protein-S-isoprenylcysteine O-methyltransferase Ste14
MLRGVSNADPAADDADDASERDEAEPVEPEKPPAAAATAPPAGQLPRSVTHFGLNSIALLVVLGAIYALHTKLIKWGDPILILCAAVAVPVVILDVVVLKVHRRSTTGIDWDKPFAPSLERVILKVAGLVMTIVPFACAYWAFPEYNGDWYNPYYNLLLRFWPGLVASAVLYITILDGHMREPRDALWQLGRLLLGHWQDVDRREIANHYRGWLVKAYFFPLMFVFVAHGAHNVLGRDLSAASWSNLVTYDFLYDLIFFVDTLFAAVGYALCFRAFDTHLRTAEPTFLGWGVALFCYPPFFEQLFEKQYVRYGAGGVGFGTWLGEHPYLRQGWGVVILLLIAFYTLATVAFGVRFSNLTHRGILTNGPYRLTKHPAYVSKNLSWWMASVPFIVGKEGGIPGGIKRSLLLGCVSFIYFMRARTEERHLSRDPTYVAYAMWMNEHGALRFLNRIKVFGRRIFEYQPPPYEAGPQAGDDEAGKPYL